MAHCVQHPGGGGRCAALAGSSPGSLKPGPASLLRPIRLLRPSPRVFPLTLKDPQNPRPEQSSCPPLLPSPPDLPAPRSWRSGSPCAPLAPGPAWKRFQLRCCAGARVGCPRPPLSVPQAQRATPSPPPCCCAPFGAKPGGSWEPLPVTTPGHPDGRALELFSGRGCGVEDGAHSQVSICKNNNMAWFTDASPPRKASE